MNPARNPDFGDAAFDDEFDLDLASQGTALTAGQRDPIAGSSLESMPMPGDEEARRLIPTNTSALPQAGQRPAPTPGGVRAGGVPAGGFNPVGDLVAHADAALTAVQIPRVTIHIFGERAETLASAERAGQDRRMARATTQIRVGGLATAIETYRTEPTPALVVVESDLRGMPLLNALDQLAEVCDAGTKVVVVGATNDIMLYRELIRRGVSEYLVGPVQPLQLITTIGSLFSDPARPFVGRSIAFVGARGGAGASTVAHNTAYALAERVGSNTAIVDYDLAFGTAGLDFNQDPLGGVADALQQPDRLDATLLDRLTARCTDRLSLFAAPASLDTDWDLSYEAFEEVTQKIRSTAPFVVLDLPHTWSAWMRQTLIAADEVVIVAAPDLASLRNAKNIIDLVRQARPNDAPPRLVLNQVGLPGRPEIPLKDFSAALGIHPSMLIPFDAKTFGEAANNGQMIIESGSKTKAAEAFLDLAQIVSQREIAPLPSAGRKSGGPFSNLFKKKG
ncbi:MAG: AAA family ATPase [Caulobacterales bacterium]|nr:AAA family ATPase [Caulobacterales bacterium]